MIFFFLYLVSFIVGAYVIWRYGRKEHYAEHRLVDISVFSTLVGIVSARAAFLLMPVGEVNIIDIRTSSGLWKVFLKVIDLSGGVVVYIGIITFFLFAIVLLRRWRWPLWPMLGVLVVAIGFATITKELLFFYWFGLSYQGWVLAGALVMTTVISYVLFLSGNDKWGLIMDELRARARVDKESRIKNQESNERKSD